MKSDTQRQKVYRWERRYVPRTWHQRVTATEAQELIDAIAGGYGIATPALRLKRMGHYAGTYLAFSNSLTLNPISGMSRGVIYHEMAHAVCAAWRKRLGQVVDDGGHGDFFMAAYLDVLSKCAGLTAAEWATIRASLDKSSYSGAMRREVPKVAACSVFEDPQGSADQARRSMRCRYCNYPWVRHDMPFHRHECAEDYLRLCGRGQGVLEAMPLPPKERRARVVAMALEATSGLAWDGHRWVPAGSPNSAPFRPTEPDHRRRAR